MRAYPSFLSSLMLAWASSATAQETSQPAVGHIEGSLLNNASGVDKPGRAVVFICDAETGFPLIPDTGKPIDQSEGSESLIAFDGYWHAETSDRGWFEFKNVPVGKYRLVAQAWSGIAGVPRGLPPSRDDPRPEPSSTITLYGTAEGVEVKEGETTSAAVKQLGSGAQRILCDPEEPHNYVLISRSPTLGDPIVGPAGWGASFRTGVIGLTRMETPYLTVMGLPAGMKIHVALFNYDDSPGVGGTTFKVGEEPVVRLPIYAGWSNGRYDPPARLLPLTEHLEKSNQKIEDLLPQKAGWTKEFFDYVSVHAHDLIEIDGFGPARLVDVLAADSYRRLRKHHQQRLQRLQEQQE